VRLLPIPISRAMPHLLDGCRAKLTRAQETIQALALEVSSFESQQPPPFSITREHRGTEYVFVASGEPVAPLRLAVLAGEIVHHLRSSLDHLIHALVVRNGQTPTVRNQFPICVTEKKFKDACDHGQIEGIAPSAEKLVRAVQPYTSSTPDDTVLYVVGQYDNADKHRLLVVVTAAAQIGDTITIGEDPTVIIPPEKQGKSVNIVGLGSPAPKQISPTGEVVFSIHLQEPTPQLTADARLVPVLVFEQCGRVMGAPVTQTLTGIYHGVHNTIESFAGEF
jgi:hypothetical protein